MDIIKELGERQTILLIVPPMKYNERIEDVALQLSGKKVGYITLNKTFNALTETFQKKGVDIANFVFVDGISETIKEVSDSKQCFFINSPAALTELSIVISKLLKQGIEYLVFDSFTNLLVYQKRAPVTKFVLNTVAKTRSTKTKAVFFAVSVREQESLIQESSMFVDKVIDLSKVK